MVWEGTWSEEMFQDFTKETGIKVNISYIDNTDTLLAKMIEGSADYDLIDLEGAYVKSFLDGELLAPIDKSKVKNVKNIQENFLKEAQLEIPKKNIQFQTWDVVIQRLFITKRPVQSKLPRLRIWLIQN